MNPITLKIIFFGLISYANTDNGNMALIVDGKKACHALEKADLNQEAQASRDQKTECDRYIHTTKLFVLEGSCGNESKYCKTVDVQSPGLQEIFWDSPGRLSVEEAANQAWDPKAGKKPAPRDGWVYPQEGSETAGFDWITSLGQASGQTTTVRADCIAPLEHGSSCPLTAQFELEHGNARVCHFYHCQRDHGESCEVGNQPQWMYGYDFQSNQKTTAHPLQALADAAIVEMTFTDRTYLTLQNHDNDLVKITPKITARGNQRTETRQGSITLLLLNSPNRPHSLTSPPYHHFELFYALTQQGASIDKRARPHHKTKKVRLGKGPVQNRHDLFECEPHLIRIGKYFKKTEKFSPFTIPHDPQECISSKLP